MLVSGDSWVSLTEANSYFNTKYGASFWVPLSNIDKESLLITAKNFITNLGYTILDTETDKRVKNAQMETVQFIHSYYTQWLKRANLQSAGVKSFSVLSFSESLGEATLPIYISNNLQDWKTNQSTLIGVISRDLNE
jgi:hypothetical protein